MESSSPKQSLALALAIRKKNAKKMASGGYPTEKDSDYSDGGEVGESAIVCSPSSIASAIRARKMSSGGEVDDDFLSAEEDAPLPDEAEAPDQRRSRLLSKVFENMRKRR